jgi:uncharacterized protein YfiM (DUF2279 family)
MRGFLLMFTLHFGQEHPTGDKWFSADKAKHFFMAAFVQSASFGGLRAAGVGRSLSLAGASVVSSGFSVGKEIRDSRSGGSASGKDLTWDIAGIVAASAVLNRTER